MSPVFGSKEPIGPAFRILVKHAPTAPWRIIHTGVWDKRAQYIWDQNASFERRKCPVVTEILLQAVIYGHPDLIMVEAYLDEYYVIEGSASDLPNRKGAA